MSRDEDRGRARGEQTGDKLTQAPDVSGSDPAVDPVRACVGERGLASNDPCIACEQDQMASQLDRCAQPYAFPNKQNLFYRQNLLPTLSFSCLPPAKA